MSTQTPAKPKEKKNTRRNGGGTLLVVLLVIILFLFLLTTIVLGSRLYEIAHRDQYTVDLEVGETGGDIELFRIEYENESGEITVQGLNAQNVVAPGTTVSYDLRLRNHDDVIIDFMMTPSVEFLTDDDVPLQFRVIDNHGNYILGDENSWGTPGSMNALTHKGSIHPGEVFTYHISWQWIFEVDAEQDAYDTYLGNQNGEVLPGVRVSIQTDAAANPTPVKSNAHMMHLLGEGFGCCWCCYLVWFLLLVCLLLVIWVWRLKRNISKKLDTLEEYEEVLEAHGLMVDGKLVEQFHGV